MRNCFRAVHCAASRESLSHAYSAGMNALTLYGAAAVTFMMLMYALEKRGQVFVALFALGCLLSSAYGFLSGAWPFGVVELIWSGIAANRYVQLRRGTGE